MSQLTLDIIGLSAFGYEFHALENASDDSLFKAYGTAVWPVSFRFVWVVGPCGCAYVRIYVSEFGSA